MVMWYVDICKNNLEVVIKTNAFTLHGCKNMVIFFVIYEEWEHAEKILS